MIIFKKLYLTAIRTLFRQFQVEVKTHCYLIWARYLQRMLTLIAHRNACMSLANTQVNSIVGGGVVIIGETTDHTLPAWLDDATLKVHVFIQCWVISNLYGCHYHINRDQIRTVSNFLSMPLINTTWSMLNFSLFLYFLLLSSSERLATQGHPNAEPQKNVKWTNHHSL